MCFLNIRNMKPLFFSWDKISVGSDWVRIFYSQSGKDLTSWSNFTLSGWKDYISKDYKLAVVYDAESEPNIIFQGGWYQVAAHDTEDFIVYFTYDDMMNVLNGSGASLDSMYNLFVGATNSSAKIYAVYAVPVTAADIPTAIRQGNESGKLYRKRGEKNDIPAPAEKSIQRQYLHWGIAVKPR